MKKLIAGLLVSVGAMFGAQAQSVTIGVDQPGFFGSITLGNNEEVRVYNEEPRFVGRPRRGAPLYIYAPPEHRNNWGRYCHYYNACTRPVYFVSQSWYQEHRNARYWERRGYRYNERTDRWERPRRWQDRHDRHDHR